MRKTTEMTGKKFGNLTVKSRYKKGRHYKCWCVCDCGNEKEFFTGNLTRKEKATVSCGCKLSEPRFGKDNPNYKHGHGTRQGGRFGSKTHRVWRGIKDRCLNPKNKSYLDYGGRGISICNRWMDFKNFLLDMGERPDGKSIERIDNDGNYEPGNCKWASSIEQTRNARSNVLNFYFGQLMCVTEAAEKFGIGENTLRVRLHRGYKPEDAVTLPKYERRKDMNKAERFKQ